MTDQEIGRMVIRLAGDGSSYFNTLRQAEQATAGFQSHISATFAAIGLGAGLVGGGGFGVKLAAELEQTEIAFGTMLQSMEEGSRMVLKIRDLAAKTPMETTSLLSAAKMMLQFGVASENVLPLLKTIGDVVGGDEFKFRMMSLAFSQMSATGRLMGQDLLQMVNAGFNPLKEISRTTGKSMSDLRHEMERGRISSQMVVKAFQSATQAGGQFEGMMEKQSQSLLGLFSTLKDDVKIVLTDIGKDIIGALSLKDVVRNASAAVQQVGALLAGLSPETKRFALGLVAVTAGGTALLWTLRGIGALLSPVISVGLSAVASVLAGMLSPLGLVVAAVVGLGTALGYSGKMLTWFGNLWSSLMSYVKPALDGVVNAIKAGRIEMAFEIAWAQVQLTFFQAIRPLQEAWVGFTKWFVEMWAEASSSVREKMVETSGWMARYGGGLLAILSGKVKDREELKEFLNSVKDQVGKLKEEIGQSKLETLATVGDDAVAKQMKAISDNIKTLEAARDRLTTEAAKAAAKAIKKPKVEAEPEINFGAVDGQLKLLQSRAKINIRFDVAEAGSAEALTRIEEYRAKLLDPVAGGDKGQRALGDIAKNSKETEKNTAKLVDLAKSGSLAGPAFAFAGLN